jgi:hypothetical protein
MVVQSIVRDGWLTGIPFGIESPGLMSGISGIGYGLLRLASPDLVPAILTLQSPKRTTDAVISHHAAGIVIVEQPTAVPACG